MKDNFIHVVFVIDTSGSMSDSVKSVEDGYKETVQEQRKNKEGSCSVSLFTFGSTVTEHYVGKDINDPVIDQFKYYTEGCTAMNDGIGTAIDKVGNWLDSMKEEEKPSQVMVVIMTDGGENASREYSLDKVKDMIKHQEEKYSWKFIYIGSDLKDKRGSSALGIKTSVYTGKFGGGIKKNFNLVNCSLSAYRNADASEAKAVMDTYMEKEADNLTTEYETQIGHKIS